MRAERSLILEVSVAAIFPTALLFSVFLLFAGHNAPGGGFVGGLVAGASFVLRHLERAGDQPGKAMPVAPEALLGAGLALAVVTGVAPWLAGHQFLESAKVQLDLPLLGTLKASSSLAFDLGVYLVVVGLVLIVLSTLGREADR